MRADTAPHDTRAVMLLMRIHERTDELLDCAAQSIEEALQQAVAERGERRNSERTQVLRPRVRE